MSHRKAIPKLVAPPPPHIHARQPIRLTASVALFTATERMIVKYRFFFLFDFIKSPFNHNSIQPLSELLILMRVEVVNLSIYLYFNQYLCEIAGYQPAMRAVTLLLNNVLGKTGVWVGQLMTYTTQTSSRNTYGSTSSRAACTWCDAGQGSH